MEGGRGADRATRGRRAVGAAGGCVAWTVEDLLEDRAAQEQGVASRLYLLEDCSSPVVVPGAVDHTDDAEAAFARFAEAGAHVVRSTDPIESWPDITAALVR